MKRINEATRQEKVKLLQLIQKGEIKSDVITENDTFILEKSSDYFTLMMTNMARTKEDTTRAKYIILNDNLCHTVELTIERFLKNVEERRANLFEGCPNYNVINLGSGEPTTEP
jgi:hypothetical protein